MRSSPHRITTANTDPALNALVEELVDRLQAGETVDLDSYRDRYPEQAGKLEGLLPAIAAMARLGWSVNPPDSRRSDADRVEARDADGNPRVLGDFRLLREIGRGGMAVVYQAEQISLRRRVALKVLPYAAVPDSRQRERFQLEAHAAALLHHPHIVPVYAVGCEGDQHYYAMQLIEGPSLAAVIRELRRRSDHPPVEDGPEDDAKTPLLHVRSISDMADGLALGHFAPEQGSGTDVGSPALSPDAPPAETDDPPESGRPVIRPSGGPASGPASERPGGSAWIRRIMGRVGRGARRSNAGRAAGFYRAAARLGIQAAEGLDHAHQSGVIHRDIKPANLLFDRTGHLWVADFGLARLQEDSDLTQTGDLVGTLRYMSPEQAMGKSVVIDHRTDIYSLGVTLYELLTLAPAARGEGRQEVLERIAREDPVPPRRIDPAIPRDLETIIIKAMARERDGRYPTAREFGEDLRRFLRGEPVRARRPGPVDRAWKWVQRHRGLVTGGLMALLASVLVLFASVLWIGGERQKALEAARDSRYESLAQRLLRILWTPHMIDWSGESTKVIGEVASIRRDDRLKGLVVAAAQGLDLHPAGSVPQGGQSITLDPSGRRLLVSGFTIDGFVGAPRGTAVWDLETMIPHPSTIREAGPVAFRPDGTPIQLTADGSGALRLWDVEQDRVLSTFPIPMIGSTGSGREAPPRPIPAALALSPDGRLFAASVAGPELRSEVFVWGADSARQRLRLSGQASVLAFSPDGSLLAGGADAGRIHVWSIRDGAEVSAPWAGETTVLSLAFGRRRGRDLRAEDGTAGGAGSWWLAAGDHGGRVSIWEAGTGRLQLRAAGSSSRVNSVAFSPDGTLLASGGHYDGKLWDVHGGRGILQVHHDRDYLGLAFSPDGRRLAAGLLRFRGSLSEQDRTEVRLWAIEDGRGIRSLRGLMATVEKLAFSPDGRSLAALSEDWRVAIWDGATGVLRLVLEPPEGITTDNSALAFSPDGRRLAFSSGRAASLWDLETGRLLERWHLPPGLIDAMGFDPSGPLLLFRVETKPGTRAPGREAPHEAFPRVGRIRELGSSGQMRTLAEIDRFNQHVFCAVAPADLSYVVVDGRAVDAAGSRRSVASFETATGKQLWTVGQPNPRHVGSIGLDPTRHVLSIWDGQGESPRLYRMPQGGPIELPGRPEAARLTARRRVVKDGSGGFSRTLIDILRGDEGPTLLTLGAETFSHPGVGGDSTAFSPDGRSYAWTHRDGTVALTDLDELNRRLTALGLGWPEEGQ